MKRDVRTGTRVDRDDRLVWIDCEMTGLNPEHEVLLEIATIVTDNNLAIIEEGPSLVIHQSQDKLDTMVPIVKEMHTKSGLIERIKGGVSVEQAEQLTLTFLSKHCKPQLSPLCGNSVWADRMFLAKYMPRIIAFLNYRIIDVTSVKELVARWYPQDPNLSFIKKETHRAMTDIRESITELAHYRKHFFKN